MQYNNVQPVAMLFLAYNVNILTGKKFDMWYSSMVKVQSKMLGNVGMHVHDRLPYHGGTFIRK